MEVIGIEGKEVRGIPDIVSYFKEFTDNGAVNVSDMIEQVESRDRQCWAILDEDGKVRAVALTRILTGNYKTCEITHLTGTGLKEWHEAFMEIEDWAKHLGCKRIQATARPGYTRIGRKYGLKPTHVILEKELGNGTLAN